MDGLRSIAGGADRIVVVDTETTGVYPTDRVVEIALITLSLDAQVLDVWDTLVQPERDVGASFIHGITASMVADAPTFADVAGDVAVRLEGACIAAHNLPFDQRMVAGEFDRLGADLSVVAGLDTLRATRAKLFDACAQHDVAMQGAHRALHDALATADLLRCVAGACGPGGPAAVSAAFTRSGRVLRREDTAPATIPEPPLIAYLASRLSHAGAEADTLAYLELVDRAVADLHLDADERRQLSELAAQLGLDEAHVAQAHRRFVNELIDAAIDDHEVTSDEYETLVRVSAALEVEQQVVERRTKSFRDTVGLFALAPSATVVFTGDHPDHPRDRLIEHAEAMGMTIGQGVTKTTDVLVASDPSSNSGKAKKAHRYGIPVVAASDFARSSAGDSIAASASTLTTLKVISCPDCLATWTVPATSGEATRKKCDDCRALRRSEPPPPPLPPPMGGLGGSFETPPLPPPPSGTNAADFEELTCTSCGQQWRRRRVRGRKPKACPACT